MLHHVGSINVKESIVPGQEKEAFLHIGSLGHAALVFVNKRLVGVFPNNYKRRFSSLVSPFLAFLAGLLFTDKPCYQLS